MDLRDKIFLGFFIFLAGSVSAFDVGFVFENINNRVGVEGVSVSVRNNMSDVLNVSVSDSNGFAGLWLNESSSYYNVSIVKGGYHSLYLGRVWSGDVSEVVYLYPVSDDGIVRVRFHDLTFGSRDFCVFYRDNQRLEGCYLMNDTVKLIVNKEYDIVPRLHTQDMLSSESSIRRFFPVLVVVTAAALVLAFLLGLVLNIVYTMMRGKR